MSDERLTELQSQVEQPDDSAQCDPKDEQLIRLPQVERLTGLKRAHLYGLARRGLFPPPLKIGARASAWRRSLVQRWIADRIREAQDGAP